MGLEYFDVLDNTAQKTGEVILRDEAHRTGVWHGAFHCLIVSDIQGKPHAIFQKRSANKKVAPGLFDVSVGGHYATGEDAQTAGPREMQEELGITVRFEELLPLGRRVCVYGFTPGVQENEFQDVYFLFRHVAPETLALQDEEVDGIIMLNIEKGIELFTGKIGKLQTKFYKTGSTEEQIDISQLDFAPCLDNYYLKLLLLAHRYIKGERNLLLI